MVTGSDPTTAPEGDRGADEGGPGGIAKVADTGKGLLGRLDTFQRSHRWLAVPVAVVKKFGDDQAGNLAALVAYYGFFSLFPLLLVFVTIVGFVLANDPEAQQRLLDTTLHQFPVLGDQLRANIGAVQGSGLALVVGVLAALWAGLGALDAMQNAMNSTWNVPKVHRPNLVKTRVRGLIMLAVLGVMIGASMVLGSALTVADSLGPAGRVLGIAVTTLLNIVTFTVAFKVLTDHDVGWKAMVPGAVVAGVAFSLLQAIGGWYVERVLRNASAMYGTFAIVLGLLTWLYLQAQLTVLASEVNVVLHRSLWPRGLVSTDLTEADQQALRHYAEVETRIPEEKVVIELNDQPAPPPRDEASTRSPAST